MPQQQKIIIISGPSGSGQDSVIAGLQPDIDFVKVVTTASRPRRSTEVEGKDYYFISQEEFERKIKAGEMVEWEKQADGQYKGMSHVGVADALKQGKLVLMKLDWKGVQSAKKIYPHVFAIGIQVPDPETARKRLEARAQDAKEVIERRMKAIHDWNYGAYDVVIVNEDNKLDQTIAKVKKHIKNYLAA
ncbi:MAG: hypothetical protein A3F54_03820 [Candidatus Kerfeldbacteria bacterium RIFCSPHIGHO2_12_FULL_48_17]|uniref:Guanylate kinase-like domain-containing protein n=1 Tax=Candidatus Kerfeldbacteria bacterium RIFCSPHIGHO2_12_FULL_48_17 TaxID=1798542 RepID=A0A1G2B4T9_9BACT|nr:MAG: hypothetical protein A3F54_03820 [Candidatus Kerfeldbacteria bacterium RIFCSPHIGHO2_12_FULL_48_17]